MTSRKESGTTPTKAWSWLDLSSGRVLLLAATLYANIVIAVTGDVLFGGGSRVLSTPGGGIDARFAFQRAFTADALGKGDFPLWNPAIFSGMPHMGAFESAVYYPPALLYRVFPLASAINLDIALHLFLPALFTFRWLRCHRLHPLAAMYGGVVAMLCGAVFTQVRSGDLAVLNAFAWTPAAFLSVHHLSRGKLAVGVIGCILALGMPVLSGYPPAALHIGLAAALYGACLFAPSHSKVHITRGAFIVIAAVPLLTAIQLFPGFQNYTRSIRSQGDAAALVSAKALSSSDALAAAAPWTEIPLTAGGAAPLYLGIATLVAAVYGLVFGTGRLRFAAMAIAPVLLLAAFLPRLSFAVPLYHYLLEGRLLAIPATLFLTAIACVGLDVLLRRPEGAKRGAIIAVAFALACCFAALVANRAAADVSTTRAFLASGGIALAAAAALSLVPIDRRFRYALLAIGVVELYVFALTHRPTTELNIAAPPSPPPEETRVVTMNWRNPPPYTGEWSASGSAALASRRYVGLLAHTQWTDATQKWAGPFEFIGYHPLMRMLRVNRVVTGKRLSGDQTIDDVLPRFLLVSDYQVVKDRDEAYAIMTQATFDPWRTVLLERAPSPKPRAQTKPAKITVTDESLNAFTLEVKLDAPAILVITDSYYPGWHAQGLSGSSQWQYEIMPANVALRAIPLGAGPHRVRLAYTPAAYRAGRWLSIATAAALAGWALTSALQRRSSARAAA